MAKVRYDLPKHKRINKVCGTCGKHIYFKRNSSGKYVPFNMNNDICHYEECLTPPNTENPPQEAPPIYKEPRFYKPKFKYSDQIKNKKLTDY